MASSVRRCSSQERRLWTCSRSNRGTPQNRREASIWSEPRAPEEIQTLSAENRLGGSLSLVRPYPITFWDEPYIGEESIRRPPESKKAPITCAQASRATVSLPTLKRSEEHTSELQSRENLVCRLLLEKKKKKKKKKVKKQKISN